MGSSRFFGRPRGRFFSVRDEARRMDRDLELYQTVYGTEVLWYFLDPASTVEDDIYDEGSVTGGKAYDGPHRMPVLSAVPAQGPENPDDAGLATYDHIVLRFSFEQARRAGFSENLIRDRQRHLLDRFVYRGMVFDVDSIQTAGHFEQTSRDVVFQVAATQVRPDELLDSPAFARFSG